MMVAERGVEKLLEIMPYMRVQKHGSRQGPTKLKKLTLRDFFFLNDPPPPEFYPLPLHDALPISPAVPPARSERPPPPAPRQAHPRRTPRDRAAREHATICRIASTIAVATKRPAARTPPAGTPRSEEHTSELQSPCNLVCRLLLEK